MTTEDTIQHLNELTETCKDGEFGYRTAAENARNTQLESVFSDYAKQRARFARALQTEVERLGGKSVNSGTPPTNYGGGAFPYGPHNSGAEQNSISACLIMRCLVILKEARDGITVDGLQAVPIFPVPVRGFHA
jgi:hypothetical protein